MELEEDEDLETDEPALDLPNPPENELPEGTDDGSNEEEELDEDELDEDGRDE